MSNSLLRGRLSLTLACACVLAAPLASLNAQTVVATIPLANSPAGIGEDPVAKRVYVAEYSQVQVINELTNAVVNTFNLPVTGSITDVKPNPATGLIYVAVEQNGLYVVSPKTFLPVAFVNVPATTLAVDYATNTIYASDFNTNLYVIDGNSNTIDKTITVDGIENVSVNPVTNRIYAAQNLFPAKVAVINGKNNKVIADVSGGGNLGFDVTVDSIHNRFADSEELGSVSVFNGATNTLTGTVQVGGSPAGVRIDPVTQKLYEADNSTNLVNVIDPTTNTIIGSVTVGTNPLYMEINQLTGVLYVGDSGSNSLSVVKTR